MKQLILVVTAFFLTTANALGQNNKSKGIGSSADNGGSGCFNQSSKIINIGIGFGSRSYYRYSGFGYSYHASPAFSLSYEQAIPNKIGPGYLGVGAYLGYKSAYVMYDNYYYNNNKYYYRHNWRYFLIAARAAYHLDALNFDKGELYFGGIVGIRYSAYSYETNSLDPNKDLYELHSSSVYPTASLFIGGRYYFAKNFGAFCELGYGVSYITAGLSLKF
ncbi:MAG: hypothetical protein JNJ41_07720 [Bacteroidia bacterium]|nr:hypothetical protein [Bacteroidia bacterium]